MRNITNKVVEGFQDHYRIVFQQSRWYVPERVCEYCYRAFTSARILGKRHPMKYASPTLWLDLFDHRPEACYFCLTMPRTPGYTYKTREQVRHAVVEHVVPAQLRENEQEVQEEMQVAPVEMEPTEEGGLFFFQ